MICLTVLFFNNQEIYCPTFQTFMVSFQGGQDLSISYIPEAELFQPWRGFVPRTYTQTVLVEMSCEISD